MTELLTKAFEEISRLPEDNQDEIARQLLEDVAKRPRRNEPSNGNVMAELVGQGWLSRPKTTSATPPPRLPVASMADLLAELGQDRSDR